MTVGSWRRAWSWLAGASILLIGNLVAAQNASGPPASPAQQAVLLLYQRAAASHQSGRYDEAAAQYKEAIRRTEALVGEKHPLTGMLLARLGALYLDAKKYVDAESRFRQALTVLRSQLPPDDKRVTFVVHELARTLHEQGRFAESAQLNRENLRVRETARGSKDPATLLSLHNLGMDLFMMRQWAEAASTFETWLITNPEAQKSPRHLGVLENLGDAARELDQLDRAQAYFQQVLSLLEAQSSVDAKIRVRLLEKLVQTCGLKGEGAFDKAHEYGERCLQLCRQHFDADHKETARALAIIGMAYHRTRKPAEAARALREWAQLQEKLGAVDSETVRFRLYLVQVDLLLGQIAEAEQQAFSALDTVERVLGSRSPYDDQDDLPLHVAEAATRGGHPERLRQRLQQLIQKLESQLGPRDPALAQALSLTAGVYGHLGFADQGRPFALRALAIQSAPPATPDLRRAATLHRLGQADLTLANFAEAERNLVESLRIRLQNLGKEHYLTATCLCDLAQVYMRTERAPQAEPALRQVSELAARKGWDGSLVAGRAARELARLYVRQRRLAEAEPLLQKTRAATEKLFGAHSTHYAGTLVEQGQFYAAAGRYGEAESTFREAVALYREFHGKACPQESTPLTGLGDVLFAQGKYQLAEQVLCESMQAFDRRPAGNDRDRNLTLELLVRACVKSGRWEQAIPYCTQSRQAEQRWLTHVLPSLTPGQQHAYLRQFQKLPLYVSLSIALHDPRRPEIARASAEWLLNGKAAAAECLADQMQLARQSTDPRVQHTLRELIAAREELANSMLHPVPRSAEQRAAEWQKLTRRERELARKLGLQTSAAPRDDTWAKLDDVRRALPANSVLIEIVRFPVIDLDAPGPRAEVTPPRYAAWVIPPAGKGNLRMVDLGEAAAIDDAVRKSRIAVASHVTASANLGPVAAAQQIDRVAGRLAELVYRPLAEAIGDASSLLISPDGGLWLFPWEALPMGDGKYLVEQKQIQYLVTGRSLLNPPQPKPGEAAVVFGDPDYDMEPFDKPPATLSEWNAFFRQPLGTDDVSLRNQLRFVRFPFQGAMVEMLLRPLGDYLKTAPRVYRDKLALESTFKSLHGPRVLVLSTHGYFLADGPRASAARGPGQVAADPDCVPDPLLRCGLSLAGANQHSKFPDSNDGVLTGLEILGADLHGTELVVLHACETRLGVVENGEGTAGLHQAFQLAGAKVVLASLWPIYAIPSTQLLELFFENLARGQGVAAGLRQAQVTTIERLRKTTGAAHPAVWAFFTATGDCR